MVCVALFPAGTSTTLGLQLSAHLSSYLMQGQAVAGTPTQPSTPAAGANATANATEVLQAPPGTPAVLVPNPADMMSPAPPTRDARAAQRDEVAICATAHGKCYAISRGLAHHPKASPMSPGLRLFSGRGSTAAPWRASKERRLVWLRPSFAAPPPLVPPRAPHVHHIPRRTALRRRTHRAGVHPHTRLIRRHATGIWDGRAHQPAPFGARTALALPRVLARPEAPAP